MQRAADLIRFAVVERPERAIGPAISWRESAVKVEYSEASPGEQRSAYQRSTEYSDYVWRKAIDECHDLRMVNVRDQMHEFWVRKCRDIRGEKEPRLFPARIPPAVAQPPPSLARNGPRIEVTSQLCGVESDPAFMHDREHSGVRAKGIGDVKVTRRASA